MGQHGYRGLVVDDEMLVRDLTTRALSLEGIDCSSAADGGEALRLLDQRCYDVMITDLRMPNTHGHALASQVLGREDPPIVIVLTGVSEPRLAKDLLMRGVTDIVFKPTDYSVLALKIKRLLDVRRESRTTHPTADTGVKSSEPDQPEDTITPSQPAAQQTANKRTLSNEDVARKMERAPLIMPISEAALNVYTMAQSSEFDAHAIATVIENHKDLSQQVIRLANTVFYNPNKERVNDLERSVVRIGTKRIGQLALAANALASLRNQETIPSLDINRIWRQSISAGLIIELLIKQGKHESIDEGLLLCATMVSLGHIVLAGLFPTEYEHLMCDCLENHTALLAAEQRVLGKTHVDAVKFVLKDWGVPETLYAPLHHVTRDYHAVAELDEPMRSQVELVKLAAILARISVRGWHGWDLLDLPPARTLKHLRIHALSKILAGACASQEGINQFGNRRTQDPSRLVTPIPYYCASTAGCDLLAEALDSMGVKLLPVSDPSADEEALLLNGVGTSIDEIPEGIRLCGQPGVITITDTTHALSYERYTTPLVLPASAESVLAKCRAQTAATAVAAT